MIMWLYQTAIHSTKFGNLLIANQIYVYENYMSNLSIHFSLIRSYVTD